MWPADSRTLLKHVGIGAALGVLLYVANSFEKPGSVPPFGMSLLTQVLGAAIGGIIIYLFAYLLWVSINKASGRRK